MNVVFYLVVIYLLGTVLYRQSKQPTTTGLTPRQESLLRKIELRAAALANIVKEN